MGSGGSGSDSVVLVLSLFDTLIAWGLGFAMGVGIRTSWRSKRRELLDA